MITHLVVPGLLGDLPRLGDIGELPRFPNLELLLSRADAESADDGYPQTLFELFGLPLPQHADVPTAAVCYHAEGGADPLPDTYLLHADPVHLRPDQDRLLAFDFHHQPLGEHEARQIAEAFNGHFAADGLRLLTPHPARWYLAVDHVPDLRTRPLSEVLGRNVDLFLPEGDDARSWRGWMNELQMLLHALPLNQQRDSSGKLPVSGLWFSGGGVLPAQRPSGFSRIEGEDRLAKGLQGLSSDPRDARLVLEPAPGRSVLDADPSGWCDAVADLDSRLKDYLGAELWLWPCAGRAWHWKPGMGRRFWRRNRPLSHWLAA